MSATLAAPAAVQAAPPSPDDEKKTLSTRLYPAPRLIPRAPLDQLPLALTVQPVLSPLDRIVRDFPDLFILASVH